MRTTFDYTFPGSFPLRKSTEELMLAVDNFEYDVLKPVCDTFGDIHDKLEIRIVSNIAIEKKTIKVKLGYLRSLLNELKKANEQIERENQQIREQAEQTHDESLFAKMKSLYDTDSIADVVKHHKNDPDTTIITYESEYERLGYYTRENGQGLIVLVNTGDESQMIATLVHEYMHAWADQEATGGMNDAEYAEEEIAEYGMLHFLQTIAAKDQRFKTVFTDAISRVCAKQNTLGLAHYGFGAELFSNYAHVEWEKLLRDAHTLIGPGIPAYKELQEMLQIYPEPNELVKTANLLYQVLLASNASNVVNSSPTNAFNAVNQDSTNASNKNANQPCNIMPQRNIRLPNGRLIGYFRVAGLIRDGRAKDLKSLKINDIITAVHDDNNLYDENAVLLYRPDGRELGFVPMFKTNDPRNLFDSLVNIPLFSATIAYMLDHQLPLTFVVSNLNASIAYKERWVEIEVYG